MRLHFARCHWQNARFASETEQKFRLLQEDAEVSCALVVNWTSDQQSALPPAHDFARLPRKASTHFQPTTAMRLYLPEICIMILTGNCDKGDLELMSVEEAWRELRAECPFDFGDDLSKYANWVYETYTSKRLALYDLPDDDGFAQT